MNYQKHYNNLIDRAKNRVLDGYVEKHHILPKCMGGSNEIENLVALTAEEHFVAHQLLIKIYPDEHKLVYAARMMCLTTQKTKRNNKSYGWLRKTVIETKPRKKRKKETKPRKKRILSREHKRKIGLSRLNYTHNDLTKQKIKDSNKTSNVGKKHDIVGCPHCGKRGGKNIMHRFHFLNCKFNL
jgi:hypothetical protein